MLKKLIALALVVSGLTFAQTPPDKPTARQYYDELRTVSGLNPLMTVVCFRDDSPDFFEVLGFTKDFPATIKAKGLKPSPDAEIVTGESLLLSQAYSHGVKTMTSLLANDKDNPDSWYDVYKSKGHKFRLVLTISPSGRYRRAVYVDNKPTAAAGGYGKCEPIK